MRARLLLVVGLLAASCSASVERKASPSSVADSEAFRDHCEAFESLDFGTKHATALRGHTWVSNGAEREPLRGVQVAARHFATGELHYVTTAADGAFDIPALSAGEYEVWSCLDGFDELRFRLVVNTKSTFEGLDLYVGPSEASGRRDVVPEEGASSPDA